MYTNSQSLKMLTLTIEMIDMISNYIPRIQVTILLKIGLNQSCPLETSFQYNKITLLTH